MYRGRINGKDLRAHQNDGGANGNKYAAKEESA
jgi:hypothetical protein